MFNALPSDSDTNIDRAGEDVPPGFDFVKLNKKNMDEIAEAGIMYEQGQSRQTRAIDSDE